MPWMESGSPENQVAQAPLPPQTMPRAVRGNSFGKLVAETSNQYSSIAVISVVYRYSPRSRNARSPVASPQSTKPYQAFMASDEDSWLLPSAKPASPEAQECPAYRSKQRRNGNSLSCRSGLAMSRISISTMPPHLSFAAQAGSHRATAAAARMK